MRRRSTLGTLGIVVLVFATGCMGLLGGGEGTPTPTTGDSTTVAPDSPTPTETATATATTTPTATATTTTTQYEPVYRPPMNGQLILTRHRQALESVGSFSVDASVLRVVPVSEDREPIPRARNDTARVSLESGQVWAQINRTQYTWTAYRAEGTTYNRLETASGTRYRTGTGGVANADRYTGLPVPLSNSNATTLLRYVDNKSLTYTETIRSGERPIDVYRTVGRDAATDAFYQELGVAPESVTELGVRLGIDQRGLVHSAKIVAEIELDAGTGKVVVRVDYNDLGSTEVSQPEWIDQVESGLLAGGA